MINKMGIISINLFFLIIATAIIQGCGREVSDATPPGEIKNLTAWIDLMPKIVSQEGDVSPTPAIFMWVSPSDVDLKGIAIKVYDPNNIIEQIYLSAEANASQRFDYYSAKEGYKYTLSTFDMASNYSAGITVTPTPVY